MNASATLQPAEGVAIENGGYVSLTDFPWLRIEFNTKSMAGQWIEIVYAAGLLEPLTRPVLRAMTSTRHYDAILPGPLFGRGIWMGLIPDGTRELWISPANRKGQFSFEIERLRIVKRPELVWRALRRAPRYALAGMGAHAARLPYVAETQFRRALLPVKFEDYDQWRKVRFIPLEFSSDAGQLSHSTPAPEIRFAACAGSNSIESLNSLIKQLRGQSFQHWSLTVIETSSPRPRLQTLSVDGRIIVAGGEFSLRELIEDLSESDLLAPMGVEDEIPAYSLAVLAEAAKANPDVEIFYGDEDRIDPSGKFCEPRFKPDWSPVLYHMSSYLGPAVFFRVKFLKRLGEGISAGDFIREPGKAISRLMQAPAAVKHIRRIMRTCRRLPPAMFNPDPLPKAQPASRNNILSGKPRAAIVIPTKDSCELLQSCIESLRRTAAFDELEIIIVDNGSVRDDTKSFLQNLSCETGFHILARPGPFNFSKLCNDGASQATADTLVFLNNDTEIIRDDWLDRLLIWTGHPDIGAVGARLLYPNRLLQHAGVVLGIDGCAGHFQRMLREDDRGYFGRIPVPHEVSAVSAACLAIEKEKFDGIEGYDACNLPVEFNDIDLCLRLGERGLKTICAGDSVLIHHESASRGASLRTNELYSKEHRYFRQKWINRLRDDPYFHPALSLDTLSAGLA